MPLLQGLLSISYVCETAAASATDFLLATFKMSWFFIHFLHILTTFVRSLSMKRNLFKLMCRFFLNPHYAVVKLVPQLFISFYNALSSQQLTVKFTWKSVHVAVKSATSSTSFSDFILENKNPLGQEENVTPAVVVISCYKL